MHLGGSSQPAGLVHTPAMLQFGSATLGGATSLKGGRSGGGGGGIGGGLHTGSGLRR